MSGSSWTDRAAARIEAWPVGPVGALMLGGATAFFCWAMPLSFMEAWFPVSNTSSARAWLIASPALLIIVLTWAGFRWIDVRTAGNSVVIDEGDGDEDWLTPASRQPFAPVILRPEPVVRPLILDAIADFPPFDVAPAPIPAVAVGGGELLLDMVLEADPQPSLTEAPLAALMERLAAEMEPVTIVAAPARAPDMPDDEVLRATIADLHRLAGHRA